MSYRWSEIDDSSMTSESVIGVCINWCHVKLFTEGDPTNLTSTINIILLKHV